MKGQAQINKNTMDNIQDLKNSIGRIESHLSAKEQGTFPAQPQPNPKLQGQAKIVNKSDG